MRVLIHNVGVEVDHADIQKAKSIEDLKKLEIFSSVADPRSAYKELWGHVKKEVPVKTEKIIE